MLTQAEAGKFTNPDGSPMAGSLSWAKGKPFSLKGIVQYYNEGSASWVSIDASMDIQVQLNQSGVSYQLWKGKAGTTGDGSFDASCLIPGDAAGGQGYIAIHVMQNNAWNECWLVDES